MNRSLMLGCVVTIVLLAGVTAKADDFKGFYGGGYVGGAFNKSDAKTTTIFSPTGYFAISSPPAIAPVGAQKPNASGFTGGGQAGYNFQTGNVVLGFEFDFGSMSVSGSKTGTDVYPCCSPTTFTVKQTVKTDWLLTARPRLGFVAGRWLFYGTVGLAATNINYQEVFTDTFATAHENGGVKRTQKGWTAGGGVEYLAGEHWTVKGEYLYADVGTVRATSTNLTAFSPPIPFPTNTFTHTTDLRMNLMRFGFNYRF